MSWWNPNSRGRRWAEQNAPKVPTATEKNMAISYGSGGKSNYDRSSVSSGLRGIGAINPTERGQGNLRWKTHTKHRGINRFTNPLNMPEIDLWDIQNGYLNRDNDIQQRNGITKYNAAAIEANCGVITVSIATPAEMTLASHGFVAGDSFYVTTTGAVPTGMSASTKYYVISAGLTSSVFRFSATLNGSAINTSGTQSGVHTLFSYSSKVTAALETRFANGNKCIVAKCGGTWYTDDATDGTFAPLDTLRSLNTYGQCIQTLIGGAEYIVYVDGGAPRKCAYTTSFGSPANLGGTGIPTDATAIHQHNSHVIMNSTSNPMKVYISPLSNIEGDYTTGTDGDTYDLRYVLPESDVVQGFASMGEDLLIIFCKKYTLVYNAPEYVGDWNIQQVVETGAVSVNCTAKHPQGDYIFFPGVEGMNVLQNGNFVDPTTDSLTLIAPYHRDSLSTLTSTNWGNINGGVSRKRNHFYICYPLSTGYEILVYSFDFNAVVGRFVGIIMTIFCEREDGTIIIGSTNGQVYTMDSGTTDDGTAITFKIVTPYYWLGAEENYKVMRKLECAVEYTVEFAFLMDYTWDTQGAMTQLSKTMTTNARNRDIFMTENTIGRGHAVQITFTNATSGAIIKIPRWTTWWVNEGTK